jgi:hypothetical protein
MIGIARSEGRSVNAPWRNAMRGSQTRKSVVDRNTWKEISPHESWDQLAGNGVLGNNACLIDRGVKRRYR